MVPIKLSPKQKIVLEAIRGNALKKTHKGFYISVPSTHRRSGQLKATTNTLHNLFVRGLIDIEFNITELGKKILNYEAIP